MTNSHSSQPMSYETVVERVVFRQGLLPPLSRDETSALGAFGSSKVGAIFADSEHAEERLGEVRTWIRDSRRGRELNAVYLDTTTLFTVEALVGDKAYGRWMTPGTLMDLATYVNAVVLFDQVFYLENRHISSRFTNEVLNEECVVPLPVMSFSGSVGDRPKHSVGDFLHALWYDVRDYVDDLRRTVPRETIADDVGEIKAAWAELFNVPLDSPFWFDPQGKLVSERWDSDGPGLLENMVEFYRHSELVHIRWARSNGGGSAEVVLKEIHRMIDECNYRSLFNIAVSNALGLPYLPNSYRLPFHRFYYRKSATIHRWLASIKTIEKQFRLVEPLFDVPAGNNLRLPFFLSAVLARVGTVGDFLHEVADIRKQAAGFRKHRAELDDALIRRDVKHVKLLRKALSDESEELRTKFPYAPVAGGIAAVIASFTAGLPPAVLAALGVLTVGSQADDLFERFRDRALRRRFMFLADQKDAALAMGSALPIIDRLWRLDREEYKQFTDHFSKLQPLV